MSLKYTQAKEGDKVIIDISFHPDSTFYSTLLNKPDFSELILRQDGIKIKIPEDKLPKTKNIDVMVDGFYQILFLEEPKQRNAEFLKPKVIEQPSLEEEQAKALSERKCPECGSNKIYYDYGKLTEGEEYCSNCGLVLNDKLSRISKEREWRAYDIEEELSRTRAGPPLTYTIHDKGLHTIIDKRNRDAFNRPIKPARRRDIYKMRKWQKRMIVQNAKERNLAYALGEIKKMADILDLPKNVIEEASIIYRKAVNEKLTWGRDIESLAGAAVYLACRKYGLNRTLREVSDSMVSEESEKS
ncbi:MAG: TFIIB-type zinc ribbon-containing protein [Candidatus Aenigmatarchaeota archaeon]